MNTLRFNKHAFSASIIIAFMTLSALAITAAPAKALNLQSFTLTVTGDIGSVTITQDNITALPTASGLGGYTRNNGQDYYYLGSYVGVPLQYLCDLVGGIQDLSQIHVRDDNTSPTYGVLLTYTDVTNMPADNTTYPFYNATSQQQQTPTSPVTLIIAYEFSNNTYSGNLPDGTGPLRLMAVDSEGLVTWGSYSVYSVDIINVDNTPSLTYATCNSANSWDFQGTFVNGENVYFWELGLLPSTDYNISVVPYQSAWTVGMQIPTVTSSTVVTTDASGYIGLGDTTQLIYSNAVAGNYDIIIKLASENDNTYNANDLLITGFVTGVFSVPGPAFTVSS